MTALDVAGAQATTTRSRTPRVVGAGLAVLVAIVVAVVLATRDGGDEDGGPFRPRALDDPIPDRTAVAREQTFAPAVIEVDEGVRVTFRNEDDLVHSFTGEAGLFHTGSLEPGAEKAFAFDGPRTIGYHCEIHPSMTGIIEVT